MKRVAILGANGQVGTETCLFLRLFPELEVIPVSRSPHGASVLRRCGFACRHGTIDSIDAARRLLGDCDAVVDLALPKGNVSQVKAVTRQIIGSAMQGADRAGQYLYMSTMSVHRLSRREPFFSTYGFTKRYAERVAMRLGQRCNKRVYVLRLGQVHGELQAVSRLNLSSIGDAETKIPAGPSNTVFVFTIAEAIRNILEEKEQPGTYTLISHPAWSWREIHEHYAGRLGMEPRMREAPLLPGRFGPHFGAKFMLWLRTELAASAYRNRDLADVLAGMLSPQWQLRLRTAHARQRVARQVALDLDGQALNLYPEEFPASGRRLNSLTDSRQSMHGAVRQVQRELHAMRRGISP